jgi:hypothetical protein
VVIEREHWWSVRPRVCDGVHRSVAALRGGFPILLRIGYDQTADFDHSDIYQVTAPAGPADFFETVLSASSFRCSAGHWIQSECASGVSGGPVEIYLPHHHGGRDLIAAELQERVRDAGVEGAVVEFLEHRIIA